jgi:hypothetical protein
MADKLAAATLTAEVARFGLPEAEFRIVVLHKQIEILEQRHKASSPQH